MKKEDTKIKIPLGFKIGIPLIILGLVFGLMAQLYSDGERGIECERQIMEWKSKFLDWSDINSFDAFQFMEIIESETCDGMIDIEKTRELNPELFDIVDELLVIRGLQ